MSDSSEITKKTLKEQLEERKINLDHVLAFSEDGQEFYTIEAVAAVFDSLVTELQKQVDLIHEAIGEFNELIEKMKLSSEDFSQQILGLQFTIANSVGRLYMIERFLDLLGVEEHE